MKRWLKWIGVVAALLIVAALLGRALSQRKAQQEAAAAGAVKTTTVVELSESDVARAQTRELAQGLPISGALKAVNSAFVKARVPGELQGLLVREGEAVKAGQVLAHVDATESRLRLRQALEQADAAKAQIDIAQRQFDNNQALVNQGFISRTALESSQASLSAARANHQAAQAAAEVSRKTLDDTVLKAPISGVIAQRLAQPGERVAVEARVVEIVDLSRMELEASVSAGDAAQVSVGQTALLRVEGVAAPVSASVARINPSTQPGSRSVLVYLALAPAAALRQGLFAEGTLGTGAVTALAIPLSALRTDKPAPYVQLIDNNRILHQPVIPGARGELAGEAMVVVSGIAENARVAKGAVGLLREGTAVTFTIPKSGVSIAVPATAAPVATTTTAR